jgi:NAD(P)-dependent dehydrogenase (short-subunit alcohol dehydrogenase family)
MKLKDRVAIVTGGSSGIGRGIALELGRDGAKVAVADVQEEPKKGKWHETDVETPTVEELETLGTEGLFVKTDVADEEAVKQLVDQTVERFGRLDILVNNAGIVMAGTVETQTSEDYDRAMSINLRAVFLTTKYAMPHLKASGRGRVINISSVHAFAGGGGPAYAASKAGVVNLTRDTASEAAADRVTANAICPGYIETPIQDYLDEEMITMCRNRTPLPRFGTPKDIGRAAAFLASDDAEWITGIALPVDGGWLSRLW